jgi:hypothetical protein
MRVPLGQVTMATDQDQARIIAERVARRLAGEVPARLTAIERAPSNGVESATERPRARVIDFVSSGPPARTASSVGRAPTAVQPPQDSSKSATEFFQFVPVAQSPWLGRLPAMLANDNPHTVDHPSQQRFGVEEATVAELVEFFENEKKCSMDPSGKPCDHCAMCSSRGF